MIDFKNQLIKKARKEHGKIFPCGIHVSLHDCFTHEKALDKLFFWFNIAGDKSTRVIALKLNGRTQ